MSEIRTTVKEILESEKAFSRVFDKEVPVKLAYRARKMIKKVKSALRDFYETREELLSERLDGIDESTEEGRVVGLKIRKEVQKALKEIIKEEVIISEEKIPFVVIKGIQASANDIADIDWMIQEPTKEELETEGCSD